MWSLRVAHQVGGRPVAMRNEYVYESPEKRILSGDNETIVFEEGWKKNSLDRGWFCRVSMNNFCVEDFATTKRGALRLARRAWRKSSMDKYQSLYGYPRVIPCEAPNGEIT